MSDATDDLRGRFRQTARLRLEEMALLLDAIEEGIAKLESIEKLARHFHAMAGLGGTYGFPESYSTAYQGSTLKPTGKDGPPKWSLYRWHIMDPVNFSRDLRVTIQALGWWPNGRYQPLGDDIASIAFWYQREPHAEFPQFPPLERRWPR